MNGIVSRLLFGVCIIGVAAIVTICVIGQEMSAAIPEIFSCMLVAMLCLHLE